MSEKTAPIIIQVLNPGAFSGRGSLIELELMDQAAAIRVAGRIANETGRGVTVRDAHMDVIETIPAANIHRGAMADYRLYTLGSDGHFESTRYFVCDTDENAVICARQLAGEQPWELWSGRRMVDRAENRR